MDYVIYTYGGFAEMIATIFNAMARLFATDSEYFTVVGKMSLTVGAIWAGTRAIFNTNIGIFGKCSLQTIPLFSRRDRRADVHARCD